MKKSRFIFCFAMALAVKAQTNSPSPATNSEPPMPEPIALAPTNALVPTNAVLERAPTEIFSDSANFDLRTREAVYVGHVRVLEPQMKISCGIMTASVPESGKIDRIVAEQNVVIDATDNEGKPIHATGDRAVYRYQVANSVTNETIELTGNPRVERKSAGQTGKTIVTGKTITWDRLSGSFGATDQHMVIEPQLDEKDTVPPPSTTDKK